MSGMLITVGSRMGSNKTCIAYRLAVSCATLSLAGCLASTTPIEGSQNNVMHRSLHMAVNVNNGGRAAAEVRSGHAIEISKQSTDITSIQTLTSAQPPVYIGNQFFPGPDQLRNEFDLSHTDISWRMREFWGEQFGPELLFGLGNASLDIAVSSTTQRVAKKYDTTGMQIGLGLIMRATQSTSVHFRYMTYFAFADGVSNLDRYELYLNQVLLENFSLKAGYSIWEASGSTGASNSAFNMRSEGPHIGLDWNFNLDD